jgi:hypothetical protein
MKRDIDFQNRILVAMVESPLHKMTSGDLVSLLVNENNSRPKMAYHVDLLMDELMVEKSGSQQLPEYRVTAAGQRYYEWLIANGRA